MISKTMLLLTFVMLSAMLLISCEDDPTSSSSSPVIKTENWKLTDDASVSNYANLNLYLHEDSSISCSGEWKYYYYYDTVTCSIMSGSVIDGDSTVIMTNGLASYPPDSNGNTETSKFQMKMVGVFNNSISLGNWEISFSNDDWSAANQNGTFTGSLKDGEGVLQ